MISYKEECFQKYNVCGLYNQEDEVGNIEDENIKTLLTLRPMNLVHYFQYLAYGTENVEAGAKPTGRRSNSLLAYKRSISYYMPSLTPW